MILSLYTRRKESDYLPRTKSPTTGKAFKSLKKSSTPSETHSRDRPRYRREYDTLRRLMRSLYSRKRSGLSKSELSVVSKSGVFDFGSGLKLDLFEFGWTRISTIMPSMSYRSRTFPRGMSSFSEPEVALNLFRRMASRGQMVKLVTTATPTPTTASAYTSESMVQSTS